MVTAHPTAIPTAISSGFFDKNPQSLAVDLLGKVLRHRYQDPRFGAVWLAARILETEAYYLTERGSHSSQGFTEKRRAMFMAPGTIYMYYARGNDSLNFSARGDGNGVLIKSAYPHIDDLSPPHTVTIMQSLNPGTTSARPINRLCRGQTLLCRSLNLKVTEWNQQGLEPSRLRLDDVGYQPKAFIQCRRLGIPAGRDEHLLYRFIDADHARHCTSNPLTRRAWRQGQDYTIRSLAGRR